MSKPIAEMRGEEILVDLRDQLNEIAAKKRSFAQQSIAISGGHMGQEELREIGVIEASAECIQFALATGQEAAARGHRVPDWVTQMVHAARLTLRNLK